MTKQEENVLKDRLMAAIQSLEPNSFKVSPKYYGEYETVYRLGYEDCINSVLKILWSNDFESLDQWS